MGLLLDLRWSVVWDNLHQQLVLGYSVLDNRSLYNLWLQSFDQLILKFSSGNILSVEKHKADGIDHMLVGQEVELAEALTRLNLGTKVSIVLAQKPLIHGVN